MNGMRSALRVVVPALIGAGLIAFALSCGAKPETAEERLARGEEAYLIYCAMCHGDGGMGNGPVAAAMSSEGATRPARLDDEGRLEALGRKEIMRIIFEGGLHSGRSGLMPAWADRLDSTLVGEIADHVMTLPASRPKTPKETLQKFFASPEGSAEDGRRLYVYHCAICHGAEGRGDGYYAEELHARNNIRPRDLTETKYFESLSDENLFVTIELGGSHQGLSTYMPAWTASLTPEEVKSLISYIRAISKTESR